MVEVLQSPIHFEFFKRFMMDNKTVHPLLFWKYVEDLKEAQFARHRNHIISVIYRKFFSKAAKQGLTTTVNIREKSFLLESDLINPKMFKEKGNM